MTELKESVKPPKPPKPKQHSEIRIRIMEIKDADGKSMVGNEVDLRRFAEKGGKKCTIKFDMQNQPSIVSITIVPDPGSSVAVKYYGKPPAWTFVESYAAGQHTVEWDGRADIDGRRLLIEGSYKVKVWCSCPICGKQYTDEKTIKIKKPYGDAYGSVYPASWDGPKNFTIAASAVRSALATLSDGSGFECASTATDTAQNALKRMSEYSSVWYWNGHAAPGRIVFYDRPVDANKMRIVIDPSVSPDLHASKIARVDTLPAKALKDVFLVVLLGCETAKSPSLPQALVGKGVDLVVSFPGKVWLHCYLPWTKAFFDALDAGEGVAAAALLAQMKLAATDRLVFNYRVAAGGGSSGKDKLLPARYGRQK